MAQELLDKVPLLPGDIRWRFIGHLQSNKAKALCSGAPSLVAVETVDSPKLANLLNTAWAGTAHGAQRRLDVYVQVNTSGEEQKGGVEPGQAAPLAAFVQQHCPHLQLQGLMTIGQLGVCSAVFFERLVAERAAVNEALRRGLRVDAAGKVVAAAAGGEGEGGSSQGSQQQELELSMGMSSDFELAIEIGSDSVRVGSAIFGARPTRG